MGEHLSDMSSHRTINGIPLEPYQQSFKFITQVECCAVADNTSPNDGCFSYTFRADLPSWSGKAGIHTAGLSGTASLTDLPFDTANLEAEYALTNYDYGVVTKSSLQAVPLCLCA